MRKRKYKSSSMITRTFYRLCTKEDFTSRGYSAPLPGDYKYYLCFDISKVKKHYEIQNGYLATSNTDL